MRGPGFPEGGGRIVIRLSRTRAGSATLWYDPRRAATAGSEHVDQSFTRRSRASRRDQIMMMWPPPDDPSGSDPQRRFPARADPDVRLTCQIADRLLADARIRRQRVTVKVQNRVVLLSGTVDAPAVKQAVADVARTTEGVVDVCNALSVTGVERYARDRGDPTTEEQRYQTIIAALQAEDPTWVGRLAKPIGRSAVRAWVAVAVIVWATMSVLMVRFGWAGVAVTCLVAGLALTIVRRRLRAATTMPQSKR